ncbi:unnamed protein product [Staurois parvus]|uniref:Uncharacterized protein n=1 Tax=Staurois parvus TaxID=386267 RepID=A0ABN9CZU6_9NEOB|nr:unnamed protein product [Staurois parvus]
MSLGLSGSPIHRQSRKRRLGHVISCGTDDQCALIISGPQKCHLSVSISASCQC